jgi:hypothetical protein
MRSRKGSYFQQTNQRLANHLKPSTIQEKFLSALKNYFYIMTFFFSGCMSCQCNNHEEMTRGHCNNVTGECYCTDNTEGEHCKHCQYGYYGDPRFVD